MRDALKFIGVSVFFIALILGGFYFDYSWRKYIVRQAIEESRAAEKP